ncbi:hypothetical protein R3P38DRAFT_3381211 [Favolaschia claudopus]|uniref:Uncharacterized protein n=1 Tax=Favolaschia claudopus TaxID=2862362 RepID=A0AAV9YZB5_9AGAR
MSSLHSKYCTTMPSTGHHLRSLLPATPSMTRPEHFFLETKEESRVRRKCQQEFGSASFSWPKKEKGGGSAENSTKATRSSVAQRARPQRELAAKIEDLLDIKEYDSQQSRAQKLRRKVEQGERRLKAFPDCDHSRALGEALDHEWKLNQPRREDRHRESQRRSTP